MSLHTKNAVTDRGYVHTFPLFTGAELHSTSIFLVSMSLRAKRTQTQGMAKR